MIFEILRDKDSYPQIENILNYDDLIEMDAAKVSKIMQNIKFEKTMNTAATLIQKFWRGNKIRIVYKNLLRKRNKCAIKIQRQWKVFRRNQFVDKIKNHR